MIAYVVRHDGKIVYVGITKYSDVENRWKIHLNAAKRGKTKSLLHQAIRTHGNSAFIVEHVASSKSWIDLCSVECALIEQYRTLWIDGGFNMTLGGEGAFGAIRSAESIAKTRAANIGKKRSLASREKQSASRRGLKLSAEHIAKIAKANTGRQFSPQTRAKIAAANTGRKASQETREKIGNASRGRVRSPESIEKTAAAHRGKRRPPEVRAKISAGRRGWTPPPELRAAVSASNRRRSRIVDDRQISLI